MKLWFCACFLFCAYSLSILIGEKNEVTYLLEDQENYDLHLNYSLCVWLPRLLSTALFSEGRKPVEISIDDLKAVLSNSSELKKFSRKSNLTNLLQSVTSNDFYIHLNSICFILKVEAINVTFDFFKHLSQGVKKKVTKEPEYLSVFVIRRRPFWFFKTKLQPTYQLLLLDTDYLDCRPDGRKNWQAAKRPYSRFECTNNCMKEQRRSPEYFYDAGEESLAGLRFASSSSESSPGPLEAEEQRRCFDDCAKDECQLDVFLPRSEIKAKVLHTELMLSTFDYWLTFAGCIVLFLNISIQELVLGLSRPLLYRLRGKLKHFKALLYTVRVSTLLVCLAVSSTLCYQLISNQITKSYDPARKETTNALLEIEPAMHLVICTPVQAYLANEDGKGRKRKWSELTFEELEKATNNDLDVYLKRIYFSFLDEQQDVEKVRSERVFFRSGKTGHRGEKGLMRCFQMQVNFRKEARFRFKSLLLISKLVIEFKNEEELGEERTGEPKLFLLASKNESFTNETIEFDGTEKLAKYWSKFSLKAGRCANHQGTYKNCTNRANCIDLCVNELFSQNHSALNIHSTISKHQLSRQQWSSLKINDEKMSYEKAKKECGEKFNKTDCSDHRFRKSVLIGRRIGKNSVHIDLHYELVNEVDEGQSIYKLALDILTIQSIFFGLNALKLILIAIGFLKAKLALNGNQIYRSLAYCICLACCIGQSILIFVFIVDEELTQNQFFERPNLVGMPELVFCFSYDKSLVDENRRFSGNYLEQATADLTADTIFQRFGYLNASNEWVHLEMDTFRAGGPFQSLHNSSAFEIRTAFFQHRKCFFFKLHQGEYRQDQFYYREDGAVFELQFKEKFKQLNDTNVRVFLRKTGTYHFSKMLILDHLSHVNVLKQELFEIIYHDRFGQIKRLFRDPLSLFGETVNLNEVDEYTTGLLGSFRRRLQMATTSWPLKERSELFDLNIENELFEQYCRQVQEPLDDRSPKNANFRRSFFINHFHSDNDSSVAADFRFELLFFKKYMIITNGDNWPKLVISLLNVLSIWLNLSIFELHEYFRKLIAPLNHLYRLLIKLREFSRSHLNSIDRIPVRFRSRPELR